MKASGTNPVNYYLLVYVKGRLRIFSFAKLSFFRQPYKESAITAVYAKLPEHG
jgi:hypothetical protein